MGAHYQRFKHRERPMNSISPVRLVTWLFVLLSATASALWAQSYTVVDMEVCLAGTPSREESI